LTNDSLLAVNAGAALRAATKRSVLLAVGVSPAADMQNRLLRCKND
jgi:hypothetical protein